MITSHWDHQYHPSRALYGPKNTCRCSCSSWKMGFSWHRREIWDSGIFGNFQTPFPRIWWFWELFCPPGSTSPVFCLGWMNFGVGLGQGKADPDPTAQQVQEKRPGSFGITAGAGITSWILWDHCWGGNNVLDPLELLPLPPLSLLSVPSPSPLSPPLVPPVPGTVELPQCRCHSVSVSQGQCHTCHVPRAAPAREPLCEGDTWWWHCLVTASPAR